MYQDLSVKITGIVPLLQHSGQLADPLNKYVMAMKEITRKPAKQKTEADQAALRDLEFQGSLYLDSAGQVCMPGICLESAIREAARGSRKGKDVERGLIVEGDWPLIYDGPKTPETLLEDGGFMDTRRVVIGKAAVMRTRPIFHEWKLAFVVMYRPDTIDRRDLTLWIERAGSVTGIGDFRPRFGRFQVDSID